MKNRHMSKKIDIVTLYLDNLTKSITGREIARTLSINHQSAINYLKELIKERVMVVKEVGRNKEHSLNPDNSLTKMLVEVAELIKGYNFIRQQKEIKIFIEELIENYPTIIIFGSYVKDYATKESDIDILIFGKPTKKFNSLKEKYPFDIHSQFSTLKKFEQLLKNKNTLAGEIIKNHIIIGKNDELINLIWRYYYAR